MESLSRQTRSHTKDSLHKILAFSLLGGRSTTTLSVSEFSDYMGKVKMWATSKGYWVPEDLDDR